MTLDPRLSRRRLLAGSMAGAGLLGLPRAARGQGGERRGGTLVVAADTEPRNLNPAIVASNGVFYVASKVIEPLAEMAYGGDGSARASRPPGRARADGRSVRFTLREGVTWHDGKPFTSADVAFSAMQVWKPLQNLGRVVFKDLEAVETPDAQTAIFRFSAPTPFQLIRNALPALTSVRAEAPLRGHRHQRQPGQHEARRHRAVPLRRAPARASSTASSATRPTGRRPALSSTASSTRCCPTGPRSRRRSRPTEIQLAAFSAVPLADLERIGKVPGVKVVPEGYEGITYQLTVEINHRRKELADARVRRAIAHAIDRNFVVDTIFLGYAKPSTGPIPRFDKQFYAAGGGDAGLRSAARQRAPRRGRLPARRGRHRASSCASCRRPGSSRRASSATTCARRCAPSGSTRRSSTTTPPAHTARGLHRPRLRPRHRLARLPQRPGDLDHDPLPGRPARRACRSRTSTATTARR